ncbi:MAG: retropepsin-like aspartic protease [Sweet potato little leaf phytoplasma]|nr:retropepsin-like aspartic protease [Sweet potato little leaf phytoplasma]
MKTLQQVEINIPILQLFKNVPRYVKFLKELCTNMGKLEANQRVYMNETVTAVLQKKLPTKERDQGMFTIPIKIGDIGIEQALLDSGASINLMPLSIYSKLNVGPLRKNGVYITLADPSSVYPEGVLEDVLVQVDDLVFPADFYVLDTKDDGNPSSRMMLLGRPFMRTARAKIDVYEGTLSLEFDRAMVKYDMNKAMKEHFNVSFICVQDDIDRLTEQQLKLSWRGPLSMALQHSLDEDLMKELLDTWTLPP